MIRSDGGPRESETSQKTWARRPKGSLGSPGSRGFMFSLQLQWLLHKGKRLPNNNTVYIVSARTNTPHPASSSAQREHRRQVRLWLITAPAALNALLFHPIIFCYKAERVTLCCQFVICMTHLLLSEPLCQTGIKSPQLLLWLSHIFQKEKKKIFCGVFLFFTEFAC